MILMTIPHLKIGVSPMVEMLRVKNPLGTLWVMTAKALTMSLTLRILDEYRLDLNLQSRKNMYTLASV